MQPPSPSPSALKNARARFREMTFKTTHSPSEFSIRRGPEVVVEEEDDECDSHAARK